MVGLGGFGGEVGEGAGVEGFPAVCTVSIVFLRRGRIAYYSFVPSSLGGRWVGWSAIMLGSGLKFEWRGCRKVWSGPT